jgi:asparagine synthase (glutamine-hydrolysing)
VFLSGGIDSSAVAYYARRHGEVRTFSIGFDDADFDESGYARTVANELGTLHAEERFSSQRCIDVIPDIFTYLDEPIGDASILPTYLLSQFTRRHVTVALGGDGGDELFAGYPTFQAEALVGAYTMLPAILREHVIAPLVHALPSSDTNMSVDFRLKRFVDGAGMPESERHQRWLGAFTDDTERSMLLKREGGTRLFDTQRDFFIPHESRDSFLNRLLWSYARTYMMDEVLVKVDRASMAHALEVRTPFLDTELFSYVSSLPYGYKHKGFNGKRLLKSVMRGKLPSSIIDRTKKGFGIPLARWLRTDLNPLMHELLSRDALQKSGVFNEAPVTRLIEEHESGHADHRKKLWTLMVFQLWHNAWIA